MKILYAEDTPLHVRAMRKIAEMAGCEFISASTGLEALALLHQQPDLVIVDVGLPDISGLTLAEQIHTVKPDMPILAVSASVMPQDKADALAAGCREFIPKPLGFVEMVVRLEYYKKMQVDGWQG